jgi:hypothetical protein
MDAISGESDGIPSEGSGQGALVFYIGFAPGGSGRGS